MITEYQEITWDLDYSELVREYLFQIGLGYPKTHSFCRYILELMEKRFKAKG